MTTAPMLTPEQVRQQFNQRFQSVMGRGATDADFANQAIQNNYTGQPITQNQLDDYFTRATRDYGPGAPPPKVGMPDQGFQAPQIPFDPGGRALPMPPQGQPIDPGGMAFPMPPMTPMVYPPLTSNGGMPNLPQSTIQMGGGPNRALEGLQSAVQQASSQAVQSPERKLRPTGNNLQTLRNMQPSDPMENSAMAGLRGLQKPDQRSIY